MTLFVDGKLISYSFLTWLSRRFSVLFIHQLTEVHMKVLIGIPALLLVLFFVAPPLPETPIGFDNGRSGQVRRNRAALRRPRPSLCLNEVK
jgi:hypothetical protein